jgi:PAS domain S-box-containing protein
MYFTAAEAAVDVCRSVRELLGLSVAFVARLEGEQFVLDTVQDEQEMGLRAGQGAPLSDTLCGWAIPGRAPRLTAEAGRTELADLPIRARRGIMTYVKVALHDERGRVVGMLCGLDKRSVVVDEHGRHLLELLGGLLAREQQLEQNRAREVDSRRALAQRAERQGAIARLSALALSACPLDELLSAGADVVTEALGVEFGVVMELTVDARHVRPGAIRSARQTAVAAGMFAAARQAPPSPLEDYPLVAATLQAPAALLIADLATDPRSAASPEHLRTTGLTSALCVAMRGPEAPLGMLGAFSLACRDFDAEDIDLVETVAHVLSSAITRIHVKDKLSWRARFDQLLTEVSTDFIALAPAQVAAGSATTLASVGAFLGADLGLLCHFGTDVRPVHRWSPSDSGSEPGSEPDLAPLSAEAGSWWHQVMQDRESVRLELAQAPPGSTDAGTVFLREHGLSSLTALAMRAGGHLLGFVIFGWHGPGAAHHDQQALLRPVGDILANALARQRIASELEESERRYRTVVDSVGDVIVHMGAEGQMTFANRAWAELTGIPVDDLVGRDAMASIHPEDRMIAAEHLAAVTAGHDEAAREVRFMAADGGIRWMEVTGRALFDGDGGLAGFSGILHDVTDRRQAEDIVRAARDDAEQARDIAVRADRAKSEFLSRMSHELRTPLNAVLGFAQLLEMADLELEDAESVAFIMRGGRHLLDLINDVLDIARIESGRLSLSLEPVGLPEVVSDSIDLIRPAAAARSLTLDVAPMRGLFVAADRQRLMQVLVNLLSNGVKYNRDGGRISIGCAPVALGEAPGPAQHGWLRLSVADTGGGIADDQLQDVFTPFERLGAERTGVEGTGIGLSLSKTLVEAMGGQLGLTSTVGEGSTFYVDLPAAGPMLDLCAGDESSDRGADEAAGERFTHTVVYIEDNPSNSTLVGRIMARRPSVRLLIATDGAAGLALVQQVRPDLVLLDLHLPRLSGQEVLAALRTDADASLRATPVVIVTADLTVGVERTMLQAGATGFLGKPVDVHALLGAVDEQLHARVARVAS